MLLEVVEMDALWGCRCSSGVGDSDGGLGYAGEGSMVDMVFMK